MKQNERSGLFFTIIYHVKSIDEKIFLNKYYKSYLLFKICVSFARKTSCPIRLYRKHHSFHKDSSNFSHLSHADFVDEAIFTISNKGNSKLVYNGFGFVKHGTLKNGATFWRCEFRPQCKGKAQTKKIGSKQMVKAYGTHIHLPRHEHKPPRK